MPLVSIITPAYNCSSFLMETFNSVINQTYVNWEWIIVDDCSTDKTPDIINEILSLDKRIRCFRTEQNSGAAKSRNIGIKNANGRFISFLDSDDLWEPNKLFVQVDFMMRNNAKFTYGNYYVLKSNGRVKKFIPTAKTSTYKSLLKKNDIGCLTVMYDASLIGKKYMPLDAEKREDYALWLDITRENIIAIKIDCFFGTYRLLHGSISSNKFKMLKYHWKVYRIHEKFGVFKSACFLFAYVLYKLFCKY